MPTEYSIKQISKKDYELWDSFVDTTSQGSIFSKSTWLKAVTSINEKSDYQFLGCYTGDELVGGCGLYIVKSRLGKVVTCPWLTPYNSILVVPRPSERKYKTEFRTLDIVTAIMEYLEDNFDTVTLLNHPSLIDIRPFKWNQWDVVPGYTYCLNPSELDNIYQVMMNKSIRKQINKAKKEGITVQKSDKIHEFLKLYKITFEKQNMKLPLPEQSIIKLFNILHKEKYCQLYLAKTADDELISGNIQVSDNSDESFDWIAGSNPEYLSMGANQLLYWSIFEDLAQKGVKLFDFCGADVPGVARHKSGFGGDLTVYYIVNKTCSTKSKIIKSAMQTIQSIKR